METPVDSAPVRDLSDYIRPLRRRWWWVASGIGIGLVLGVLAAGVAHRMYTSTASVEVTPTGVQQDVNNVNGRTQQEINLDTETQIVKSDAVAARVRRALHASVSLGTIERRASVTVPANTTVLRISYQAGSSRHAAAGAQAFAMAYLAVRGSTAAHLLRDQEAAVRKQIGSIANELKSQKAQSKSQGSQRALRYKALETEAAALGAQLSTLSTTVVTPGNVIAGPTKPTAGRTRMLFVLGGLMIGLLFGAGGAIARDRTDTRLRDPRDLEDAGIRVIGAVDTPTNATRTYTRLANAVLGAAPDRRGLVLVAGPTWEPSENEVALKVAAAIRDVADRVALVRVADRAAEVTQLGARSQAKQGSRAPKPAELPSTLAAATRGALRQSMWQLKEEADFVIVDAADPIVEAVLPACDTALLVVSVGVTRVPDVVDAASEMERSGVRVLGAVVVPGDARPALSSRGWIWDYLRPGGASAGGDSLQAPERTSSQA